MTTRQLPQRDYLAIKAAFRDLIEAAGGTNRASEHTRAAPSMLSRYGAVHESAHPPADVIADLEAEVGQPIVTRVLAELGGFNLVPKEQGVRADSFISDMGDTAKDAGALLGAFGEAIADGEITPGDARKVLAATNELQEGLASVEARMESVLDGNVVELKTKSA